jgi:hypothetical protein
MPQDMVVRILSDFEISIVPNDRPPLFRLVANGAVEQVPSPYTPKYLLIKMPYRFNTSFQLLAPSSADVLCDWFLSLDLQRSRP